MISVDLYFTQCKHNFPIDTNYELVFEVQYFVTIYSNKKYFIYGQFLDIKNKNSKDRFTDIISLEITESAMNLILNNVVDKIFKIKVKYKDNSKIDSKSNFDFCKDVIKKINKEQNEF